MKWATRSRKKLLKKMQISTRKFFRVCPITRARICETKKFFIVRKNIKIFYDAIALAKYFDFSKKLVDPMTRSALNSIELRRLGKIALKNGYTFQTLALLDASFSRIAASVIEHEMMNIVLRVKSRSCTVVSALNSLPLMLNSIIILYVIDKSSYEKVAASLTEVAPPIGSTMAKLTDQLSKTYHDCRGFFIYDRKRILVNAVESNVHVVDSVCIFLTEDVEDLGVFLEN